MMDLEKMRTLLLVSKVPRTKENPKRPYPFLFKVRTKVCASEREAILLLNGDEGAEERLRTRLHDRGYYDRTFSVRACYGGFPSNNAVIDEMSRQKVAETGRLTGFPEICTIEV